MNLLSKIYIAGHKGLVGSAILRKLEMRGYKNLIYQTSAQLDPSNAGRRPHHPRRQAQVAHARSPLGSVRVHVDIQ